MAVAHRRRSRRFFRVRRSILELLRARTTCSSLIGRGARKVGRKRSDFFFFLIVCFSSRCPPQQRNNEQGRRAMGADVGEASGHGPSEFSIVHDSIRRDREALFEGTRRVRARSLSTRAPSSLRLQIFSRDRSTRTPDARARSRLTLRPRAPPIPTPQFIPSIEADSDDDGSSDGELPIFFTSTEPGAPSSSAARHGADSTSSGATHTARAAPVHRDESDELAAFERAASEALRREEERSARIVAAHLAPDEHHHRHPRRRRRRRRPITTQTQTPTRLAAPSERDRAAPRAPPPRVAPRRRRRRRRRRTSRTP